MYVRDAFRAQYFIDILNYYTHLTCRQYNDSALYALPIKAILSPFLQSLALEIDGILLPIIAQEIAAAKLEGVLAGPYSANRYSSFFIKSGTFTERARAVPKHYPFLFSQLDRFVETSFANLHLCIERLHADFHTLTTAFGLPTDDRVMLVDLVTSSDRHRDQQMLAITSTSGHRFFYKPTCLTPDALFSAFIDKLQLTPPYNLKTVTAVDQDTYGWLDYVPYKPCSSLQELRDYYKRAGVLLACADGLNYSDGHFENLIASGTYPVLLDGETFFQNYTLTDGQSGRQDIFGTHLILDRDPVKETNFAALQTAHTEITEKLIPTPIKDGTDELRVRFFGKLFTTSPNAPSYRDKLYTAHQFVSELIEGFSYGYDQITHRRSALLENNDWWDRCSRCRVRTVLRDTGAYVYLLRYIQQPEFAANRTKALEWLLKTLYESPQGEYEAHDILTFNIPYFYHYPSGKELYDGQNSK